MEAIKSNPKLKWGIIIGSISLVTIIVVVIIIIVVKSSGPDGKGLGAYNSTPDPSGLQYRTGNGIGGIGNGWDDGRLSNLSSWAGYDGQRKKLPEYHLDYWGIGIEIGDCKTNTKCGILDVVGYLCGPSEAHSSKRLPYNNNNREIMPPSNLYEPIWLEDGSVNPNNYWANFINQTVTLYKDHIKIWETWNEPDYVTNYQKTAKWESEPPNKDDLVHWHGTIFEYIRLLRITYEVGKKADPSCWIATGGLGYTSFLDAILRYTDNPIDGSVTDDYPAYGGAYFDCDAYHQYPKYGVTDEETKEGYHEYGSDTIAKKVVILKKNHHYTIKKYGFGDKYPDKIFINTETGYDNGETKEANLVRRNWIIKLALYQIEYDVKQIHSLYLCDGGISGMGDFQNLGQYVSVEEGIKHLKDSSKGRLILKQMNIGKFIFDEERTKNLREKMPTNVTGIVLKRKFPKENDEKYYFQYIYSIWVYCKKEELPDKTIEIDLPFDPLFIDWEGNVKQYDDNDLTLTISSTPIFLLGDDSGLSGFAIFMIVFSCIIGIVILGIVGLYIYKRFFKKKEIPVNKNFFKSLLH